MPTKLNRAGEQQNYVPKDNGDASGEYGDNETGSNVHITFKSFKKPEDTSTGSEIKAEPKKEKPLGIKVEDKGKEQPKIETIKSNYNGKGQQILLDELKRRMPRSKSLQAIQDNISGADDELSGVIADYLKENPDVQIKVGKNLNSKYQTQYTRNLFTGEINYSYSLQMGQGIFTDSEHYAKGGVFFHETGHALDNTFINENGMRSHWSNGYMSKKHNKTLAKMINEEIRASFGEGKIKTIKDQIEKEKEEYIASNWGDVKEKELESLKAKKTSISDSVKNNPEYKELESQLDKSIDEIAKFKLEMNKVPMWSTDGWGITPEYQKMSEQLNEMKKTSVDLARQKREKWDNLLNSYPEYNKISSRYDELFELKWGLKDKAESYIDKKYGDLSDMCSGNVSEDLCGMGHDLSYWWKGTQQGKEAFAEIMSAKATNPESYKLMQKYIPKSLEIFEEIMGEIRNGKEKSKQ